MSKNSPCQVLFMFIVLGFLGANAAAQPDDIFQTKNSGEVRGTLNYCGLEGSGNILVYIPGHSFVAITDGEGNFTLAYVPIGTWSLKFSRRGQLLGGIEVTVVRRQLTDLNIIHGPVSLCDDLDGDGFPPNLDCDDSNPQTYPNSLELCGDGRDNNCNGDIDESCPTCTDTDGDGYPAQSWCGAADCNDANALIHPGANEQCGDGLDNDCDGQIDEADALGTSTFYLDADEDGFGDLNETVNSCVAPDGYVDTGGDCDDSRADVYPGAFERCETDGMDVDNDCSGSPLPCEMRVCSDQEVASFEACVNSCEDLLCTQACVQSDELSPVCQIGIVQLAACASQNGCLDLDQVSGSLCAYDACPDEWMEVFGDYVPTECSPDDVQACGYSDVGACMLGMQTCGADGRWSSCTGEIYPAAEVCDDSIDNDCNGLVDDCDPCRDNPCTDYPQDIDVDGDGSPGLVFANGVCTADGPTYTCEYPSAVGPDCDDGNPSIFPGAPEICDGIDNNCNGMVDENCSGGATCDQPFQLEGPGDYYGYLVGASNIDAPCAAGDSGPEQVIAVTVESGMTYQFTVSPDTPELDLVLYLLSDCQDANSQLVCEDVAAGGEETLTYTNVGPATTLYLVVDSWGPTEGGYYLYVIIS